MVERKGGLDSSSFAPEKSDFFCLRPGVFLIDGAKRAAIYDTSSGNVYSLNTKAKEIILERKADDEFYAKLEELGLVDSSETVTKFIPEATKTSLEFMWLELTAKCNLACLHCYAESSPSKEPHTEILANIWESVIEQGAKLGCRQLQFIGGEPFCFDKLFELAICARNSGYQFIEIFTNGTFLSPSRVKTIKDLGINVAVSLYSNVPEIHDLVTGFSGSFEKTLTALRLLKESNVPTRVGVVIMRQNQSTVESTLEMVRSFGFKGGESADVVRLVGRGKRRSLLPEDKVQKRFGLMSNPSFITDKGSFERSLLGNPCWLGKIAVAASGDILPCVVGRTHVVGAIPDDLEKIIESNALQNLWGISKDRIKICSSCEYRYSCGDCRPLAEAETGDLYAKTSRCSYNPFTGEW